MTTAEQNALKKANEDLEKIIENKNEEIERLKTEAGEVKEKLRRLLKLVMTNTSHCKGCGAVIYWIVTRNGKRMPVNPDGTSHFATCPKAGEFRKRNNPR